MRRLLPIAVPLGCLLFLLAACYGSVVFRGQQFGFRDAAHFYYPLYQRVQTEWEAGRWPLWAMEENSGMPLLGQPTAAVLYPGKLIFALVSYPWGVRLYTIGHTVLAFAGMLALVRSFNASWTGAALAGLSFAFGAPVLFQYCNIIFLVGAAWLPLGLRASDRWLRLGDRRGLLELAVVLGMQTLGGDPQAAYITGLCAGGYAVGLARRRGGHGRAAPSRWPVFLALAAAIAAWVPTTLVLAQRLPKLRARGTPTPPLPWMQWVPLVVAALWGTAALLLVLRWKRRRWNSPLVTMLAGLSAAAALSAGLIAAQLFPVLEFSRLTARATAEGPHDVYPFSLQPFRCAELVWPNVFGTRFDRNRCWIEAIAPGGRPGHIWVPSLYMGGLPILLAAGAFGFRGGPPWRAWLSAIALVSLFASFGEYSSPIYWGRLSKSCAAQIGRHDPNLPTPIRLDGYLRDGDGGFYWFLNQALPGFRQFRYPSKLLSFTAVAVAALAGIGWDRLLQAQTRRVAWLAAGMLAVSALALIVVNAEHGAIVRYFARPALRKVASAFGPIDAEGSYRELRWALGQGAVVFAAGLLLVRLVPRRPALAGALALIVLSADLAVANARLVMTVPQKMLDLADRPEVVERIRRAEEERPSDGPFRVHRMPVWGPVGWKEKASLERALDFVAWERATIQPKYGITFGVEYTLTLGTAELYDYEWYFGGFPRRAGRDIARVLGIEEGKNVVVYPRRGFDLWNTRYFVLPFFPNGWDDENRAFAAFLPRSERIYPAPDAFKGPDSAELQKEWIRKADFQILRNLDAFPRAWVVHDAHYLRPLAGMSREERNNPMLEILYAADPLWTEPNRTVYDPRVIAWMEDVNAAELAPYVTRSRPRSAEKTTVKYVSPQRVELDVALEQPGIVVLADVYYPGWRLTIDGRPAPIYRANRIMRGAAVPSGRHRLVYTYEPLSFRLGCWISVAGLAALLILGAVFARWPYQTQLAGSGLNTSDEAPDFGGAAPAAATPDQSPGGKPLPEEGPLGPSPGGPELVEWGPRLGRAPEVELPRNSPVNTASRFGVVLLLCVPAAATAQTPRQPKVAPGPGEPDLAVLLKQQFGLEVFGDLVNSVATSVEATPGLFRKAGKGPVTFLPIIALGLPTKTRGGYYRLPPRDQVPSPRELWSYTFKNTAKDLETGEHLPPPLHEGSEVRFDPGEAPFGIWVSNDGLKDGGVFSEPRMVAARNARLAGQPYKLMIYPNRDRASGKVTPNSFLLCWEYSTNDDFQDVVCRIENVELLPASSAGEK